MRGFPVPESLHCTQLLCPMEYWPDFCGKEVGAVFISLFEQKSWVNCVNRQSSLGRMCVEPHGRGKKAAHSFHPGRGMVDLAECLKLSGIYSSNIIKPKQRPHQPERATPSAAACGTAWDSLLMSVRSVHDFPPTLVNSALRQRPLLDLLTNKVYLGLVQNYCRLSIHLGWGPLWGSRSPVCPQSLRFLELRLRHKVKAVSERPRRC